MSEWRTIDSAPKDGDQDILLLGLQNDGGHFFAVGQWWVDRWAFMFSDWRNPNPVLFCFEPTHWMPLPDPPATD